MAKYYRAAEDLGIDLVQLTKDGQLEKLKDGEVFGRTLHSVKAGKKISDEFIEEVGPLDLRHHEDKEARKTGFDRYLEEQLEDPEFKEGYESAKAELAHDHDHDGEPDHAAEDCDEPSLVETEVIEAEPVPKTEKRPWWWRGK